MTYPVPVTRRTSPVSVASILEASYARYGSKPALLDGDVVHSYADLGRRVHRVVAALTALGATRGDRVAVLGANSPVFIEVSQAAFVGGFVRVAPSSKLHPLEVVELVEDCRARFLFVDEDWAQRIPAVRDRMPSVEHVIGMAGAAPDAVPYAELIDRADPGAPEDLPGPDELCALLYTSGTTGRPKGAMLTHGNWAAMIRNSMIELPPIEADEVMLHVAPLSHFSGYVEPTYSARGAFHIVSPQFNPAQVVQAIERHRVTAMPLVPTMLNMLLPAAEARTADVSSMRTIVYGGSGIAPDRLARAVTAFGDVFVQFFGLSETPMPLAALSPGDHRFAVDGPVPPRLASAGRVNPFVELRICDEERAPLPAGEVGEIVVRGDVVMAGYWERPEQTAEMIDEDGWAATGDLGRIDADGYLYVVDRKRDMIVTGGYNVYPTEVENAISALPDVHEVAVVGAPDEQWGEAVVAVVVPRPGAALTAEDVVAACLARLATYKKPRAVEFVEELPRTGSGKIMRRQLRERLWAGRDRHVG
ncbi:AMP-binding protein [Pseudonocardia kunmingensis]|uniref:Acyl-CoA synthetase (AMP-forming)/AMP-acid ligase II n=1 Tax=Pseudonocardia kunmingensis TaxID=630975 RepID=A0A543DP24_9PSEU|nr:AMP-binding protein [Pseudonocardia kunmingensis]TQM11068.1 acyl-CoA synthetase (AMP-forming)/AMP-acid ligase II [Pseudonocardia kunmingensis]